MDAPNSGSRRQPVIGILGGWLDDDYLKDFRRGAAMLAAERGATLIFYAGGGLGNAGRNALYEHVLGESLDGLLIVGAVMHGSAGPESLPQFYERFKSLPCVSIGDPIDGMPSVLVDNYSGMFRQVEHLIVQHQCRQPLFIAGPKGNHDAHERLRAFKDAINKHGLEYDPRRVIESDFSDWGGAQSVRQALDCNVPFDSISAANDGSAVGASRALEEWDVRLPFAGFDDTAMALAMSPPMTTVRQPVFELGHQGLAMLLDILDGKAPPLQPVVLATELVVRQSCGCVADVVRHAAILQPSPLALTGDMLAALRTVAVPRLADAMTPGSPQQSQLWALRILDAAYHDIFDGPKGVLATALEDIAHEAGRIDCSVRLWQNVVSILRDEFLPLMTTGEQFNIAESVLHQARVVLAEIQYRSQAQAVLMQQIEARVLLTLSHELVAAQDYHKTLDVLASQLPDLHIPECYLVVSERGEDGTRCDKLVLSIVDGRRLPLPDGGVSVPAGRLLPDDLYLNRQGPWLACALSYGAEALGHVVFPLQLDRQRMFESLCTQISTVLKSAMLQNEHLRAEQRLGHEREVVGKLIENTPDWIFFKDTQSRFTRTNRAHARALGESDPAALIGRDDHHYFPHEVAQSLRAEEQRIMTTGEPMVGDVRHVALPNGDKVWVSETKLPLTAADGTVVGMVGISRDVSDLKRAEEQLAHQAFHDSLTRLPNRALFMDRLRQTVHHARRREDFAFAVLFMDLDHFKNINDTLGHDAGDELLIAVARRLENCVRPGDTLARLGGDEFTVLLYDIKQPSDAVVVAERIREELRAPFEIRGKLHTTTASIGMTLSTRAYDRAEDLLKDADAAMYRAKAAGKNRHVTFEELAAAKDDYPEI